jgi:hypothetical protein
MRTDLISLALLALMATSLHAAPPADAVEPEPALSTATMLGGRAALSGPDYRLPRTTPVRQFMGRFQLETEMGNVDAVGTQELLQRIGELPAARRLLALERSEVFASALAQSAREAGQTLVRVVAHPVDTLSALPAGVGRALLRAGRRVRDVATAIGDASQRDSAPDPSQDEPAAGEPVIDFAREMAGVNAARRAIAKDLGIDPYTRNPLLAERLGALAWASVAGGVSVDLALAGVPSGARHAIDGAGKLDRLAWDLPPADIRRQLEQRLRGRGHSGFSAREFLRNPAFSPSDQLRLVDTLALIDLRDDEGAVLSLATTRPGPRHARFLQNQLDMLAAEHARTPLRRLRVEEGMLFAIAGDDTLLVPLPVDHLSWTAELKDALAPAAAPPARHR